MEDKNVPVKIIKNRYSIFICAFISKVKVIGTRELQYTLFRFCMHHKVNCINAEYKKILNHGFTLLNSQLYTFRYIFIALLSAVTVHSLLLEGFFFHCTYIILWLITVEILCDSLNHKTFIIATM